MTPMIKDGDIVTVSRRRRDVTDYRLRVGTPVLARVHGRLYLHKITAAKTKNGKVKWQIGNNKGHVNGWASDIIGIVIEISSKN